jgi:coenzyme F420 biosynthesis associated uncharacterized protein
VTLDATVSDERSPAADSDPPSFDPLDWDLAERVARRVAGRDPLSTSYLGESLRDDFASVTGLAEQLVAEYTGLCVPGSARAQVVDRASWVSANVQSMRRLLAPLTARVGAHMARSPVAPIGRRIAGTETGVLLGYLAQRVLGQYDLLVLDDDGASDAVYYVGGNILSLEKRFAFRPRDFRLWIAVHECTHRAQFTGVPWMKPYYLSLVHATLSSIDPDPRTLVQALARAADELRSGRNPLDDGGLVALLATDEQRGALSRVQSLMSLLEGHGNSVMNRIGRDHVAGQARMARVLQARRQSTGLASLLHKIVGLDSKMRQYEVGEAFIADVEREAGPRAIDPAWQGPEMLPTADELRDPQAWLHRVA